MIKRERYLYKGLTIAINLLDYDLQHYEDVGDKDAVKEVKASIKRLKGLKRKWLNQHESDQNDFGILGLLSLHESELPASLVKKLFSSDVHKFEDRDGKEHFFGVEVQEHMEEEGETFTKAERQALAKLRRRMAEQDCGYFRFIF